MSDLKIVRSKLFRMIDLFFNADCCWKRKKAEVIHIIFLYFSFFETILGEILTQTRVKNYRSTKYLMRGLELKTS